MLAAAAARCMAATEGSMTRVGNYLGTLPNGDTEARDASDIPSFNCGPARKHVAKAGVVFSLEYMKKECINVVTLQETIKADFTFKDLLAIDPLQRLDWHWVASTSHLGRLRMGCTHDACDVIVWEYGVFFIVATVRHHVSGLSWVVGCVYGPADHTRSAEFLSELIDLVGVKGATNLPRIMGGDFNLIRSGTDKNNGNVD
ncbi:hypothetical protein D1007_27660 [Hordeum vulgare]|nr:hypothetical protein D1007_27660 [Hordeum vulgare]